jgi:hypothetical protein
MKRAASRRLASACIGKPRFYPHPYQSPQRELWETSSVEWFAIIGTDLPVRRRKRTSWLKHPKKMKE